jgi:hypothetical protein
MDYDAVIATALGCIPSVREFRELFPSAEHTLVKAKRDFDPDGWQIVYEWISRSHLHDRYVVWLVVAIDIGTDGSVTELETPNVYVLEVDEIEPGRDEQRLKSWKFSLTEFEEGDWGQLVESGGDFSAIGIEIRMDSPVGQFATYWRDTRPIPLSDPGDGMAFKAPLRFMMQKP